MIHHEPELSIAHASLANALLNKGRLDEAVIAYWQAAELNPIYAGKLNYVLNMKRMTE